MFHFLISTPWQRGLIERSSRAIPAAINGIKESEMVLSVEDRECFVIGLPTSPKNSGINPTCYHSGTSLAFASSSDFHTVRFID